MLVEQRSTQEAGTSIAPCTTSTSTNWYLAEGFTAEDSTEQLVLTNPFDQTVIVDVGFATDEGSREPPQLQGFPVPPRSVQVIDMDSIAARDEPQVAVRVSAQRGASLLVGRAQLYDGGGRLGYSMTLASPVLRSQWWFANGLKGPGITERYSIYNPGDEDVQVQPLFLGIPSDVPVAADPITVPAGELVTYSPDAVTGLPDGRHGILFDTQDAAQSLVVERAITRTIEDVPTTSVLLGGVARGEDALRPERVDARHRSRRADRGCAARVQHDERPRHRDRPGRHARRARQRPWPRGARAAAGGDLADRPHRPAALDAQLVLQATTPVFVERSIPREPGAQGRSASWAVPVVG